MAEQNDSFKDVTASGGTWTINIKPKDVVTTAINGVICHEFVAPDYATWQMKTWQQLMKKN